MCIYCNKEFKDFVMLKEHMRKKNHKRIDPKDKSYDQFYMINYLVCFFIRIQATDSDQMSFWQQCFR